MGCCLEVRQRTEVVGRSPLTGFYHDLTVSRGSFSGARSTLVPGFEGAPGHFLKHAFKHQSMFE